MVDENLLSQLYSARLDELREMAISHEISKAGNVEQLRARLIDQVALAGYRPRMGFTSRNAKQEPR